MWWGFFKEWCLDEIGACDHLLDLDFAVGAVIINGIESGLQGIEGSNAS
jgi:hypothetical protein